MPGPSQAIIPGYLTVVNAARRGDKETGGQGSRSLPTSANVLDNRVVICYFIGSRRLWRQRRGFR